MGNPTPRARLGVDIGGTFTDVVLEVDGKRHTDKVLTTHSAPEEGVMESIDTIVGHAGIDAGDVRLIIHGTTLATNALIERNGAKTALITTEGFRDTLEIRLEHRFEQYDIFLDLPDPLVPRNLRLTVPERLSARGEILLPLDEEAVRRLAEDLERLGVESVAVGFLHSYVNPDHERRAGAILKALLPDLAVTLSSEVAPEMREYERISTACANAYIQPAMARYLVGLERNLRKRRFSCPLLMMLSGGGLATVETSRRFPVRLVESGPAGGAIFSSLIAAQCGLDEVVSFDMGGTTAKICLIDNGRPQTARSFEVGRVYRFKKGSGLPLRIPVIEMVEIGAGGGSIARVDPLKRIAVGPRSAGSVPGPACYDRGGFEPTVTDANVVLGRIDPDNFSGGRIPLDTEAARHALQEEIGSRLDLAVELAALGVSEIVDETMASAARVHAVESGKEASTRTLVAFGGGGPLHATRVAEKIGIDRVLIPTSAGVGSAVGFLQAPVAYEIIRSHHGLLSSIDLEATNAVLTEMSDEAARVVEAAASSQLLEEKRIAYMRYFGQGHEIAVEMPVRVFTNRDGDFLRETFEREYQRVYGRILSGADVEILTWIVRVRTIDGPLEAVGTDPVPYSPKPVARRQVFDAGRSRFVQVPVYQRTDLKPGAEIQGPAIIMESETSTVVSSGFDARVDRYGYIECNRLKQGAPASQEKEEDSRPALINLQIMWNRLIAVVEEQANTLVFAAFSTPVREGGDLSAGVFDTKGRMLAQAVTGTPGHVNTMARAVRHFFEFFPPDSMKEGDSYITNHPWKASGHLNDVTLVTPAFRMGRLVGLFAATVHLTDIGGRGMGTDARQVYEEGL